MSVCGHKHVITQKHQKEIKQMTGHCGLCCFGSSRSEYLIKHEVRQKGRKEERERWKAGERKVGRKVVCKE